VFLKRIAPKSVELPKKPPFELLVVDMQDGYYSDMRSMHYHLPNTEPLVDLLLFARKHGIPVHFLEYNGAGDTFGRFTMLAPRHFRYVKDDLDGFTNREFRVAMMELQGRNLVVAGYNYSACVLHTLRSARNCGIDVISSPDLLFYSRAGKNLYPSALTQANAFYDSQVRMAKDVRQVIDTASSL
jgi:nicotinamidase-related amidase